MAATREAYGKALKELGDKNPNVVVLDADLSGSTQTKHFAKAHPDRFFNMGIAEMNMIGTAAGLARMGKIPFASSFAMFAAGRAWEFVRNSVAHNHLNVKVCATHAGLTVGEDGASHQIIEDVAIMRVIPTMTVIVPADAIEAYQAIYAIAEYDGPVYARLGRAKVPVVFDENYRFQIGKAATLLEGSDVSLIACGVMVYRALEAAKELAKQGIKAEVINMATIKPLDNAAIIKTATKTGRVITLEEHNVIGGLGDAVAAVISEEVDTKVKFKRMGIEDKFGQSGDGMALLDHYGLAVSDIVVEATRQCKA
ncbi:MAG: transketolase family protein [Cyanobacteria bacterium]|nr:transketolase family protein [Cyanobacteriota bacterium]MDA1020435.1 transketolase family protein [Cyanobacteriota bacterium]